MVVAEVGGRSLVMCELMEWHQIADGRSRLSGTPHVAMLISKESRVTALFTLIFLVCLSLTHGESEDTVMFCISGESNRNCYTIYRNRLLSVSDAAEVCRRQPVNGRLVTVLDETTQQIIVGHLNVAPNNGYWLGARLMLLDHWTWLDNSRFIETSVLKLPDRHSRGYMTVTNVMRRPHELNVIPINDPPRNNTRALCKCTKTDVRECFAGKRYSTHWGHKRWHNARSRCTEFNQTDLAVLSEDDVKLYEPELFHYAPYYIGLRNVLLVWNSADSEEEATYVNWADDMPSPYNDTVKHLCVYAAPTNWKWRTGSCDRQMAFICENVTLLTATTTPRSPTLMMTTSSIWTPAAAAFLLADSANTGVSIGLSLSIIVITAVIIIACVIVYFRRKLLVERQGSPDHQIYSSIAERHLSVIEEESAYALINDADVTDASYGTKAAATGNTTNGVPGYSTVQKIPTDRPNDKALANNTKKHPDRKTDQSTVNVTVADGTGYYGIASVPESQPPTSSAHESGYETPTPCAQPSASTSGQANINVTVADGTGYYTIASVPETQPPTSSALESGYETPTPVHMGVACAQPSASAAVQRTGSQPMTSSGQDGGYEMPADFAFDNMMYMHSPS